MNQNFEKKFNLLKSEMKIKQEGALFDEFLGSQNAPQLIIIKDKLDHFSVSPMPIKGFLKLTNEILYLGNSEKSGICFLISIRTEETPMILPNGFECGNFLQKIQKKKILKILVFSILFLSADSSQPPSLE